MRLNKKQIHQIHQTVARYIGERVTIYLFGSRLDDTQKGGDLDLLIECEEPISLMQKARMTLELEQQLSMPVDIIGYQTGTERTPFQQIALAGAVPLEHSV